MRERAQILVLNTTAFGEKSLILHCISNLWGRRSFIVSRGGKTSSSLYQPMTILDCEVSINPKSDLWRAHALSMKYPLASLRGNVAKTAISLFMSEVLYRTVRDGSMADDDFYRWCEQAVLTLDALGDDFSNFHIVFLLGLASALGFRPSHEALAPYAGENHALIGQFLTSGTAEAMLIKLSGTRRADICRSIVKYLEYHTDSHIEIRSLDVLHELFA